MKTHKLMSTHNFSHIRKWFQTPVLMTLLGAIILISSLEPVAGQNRTSPANDAFIVQLASAQGKSDNNLLSIQYVNVTLQEALELLAKKINVGFSYNPEIMPEKRVNFSMTNVPPHEVIYKLLEGTNLEPVLPQSKDVIVIREKEPVETIEAVVQNISGTVVDAETGEVLPGVNVIAGATDSGSIIGTTTDLNGQYEIEVPDDINTLVFSYVGYLRLEITIDGRSEINVELSQDVQMLEEAIVLGYAYQDPNELTGSVSRVGGDEINEVPATSVSQALQGRVAGVQVVNFSGEPGTTSDIVIRGGGSVNGMPPLFIVDGVRMGTDYNFNNQDVESIEILKDASAAAIYGAQAAGGVVLIQTKRGQSARGLEGINVSLKSYYGFSEPVDLIPLMGTQQMFEAREAFGFNTSAWGNPSELPNTDWNDVVYGTGTDQNHTMSLTGASDNSNFFVSGNYFQQEGIQIENSFERYSLRVNSDFSLSEKFRVGETLYLYKSTRDPRHSEELFRTVPSMSVKDENGEWGKAPDGGYFNGRNWAQEAYGRQDEINENAVEGNIYVDYEFFDGLNMRGTFGASVGSMTDILFEEAYDTGAQSAPAEMEQLYTDWQSYTGNLVLTFDRSFGNHNLNARAGYEVYKEDSSFLIASAAEFSAERTTSFALNSNVGTQRVSGGENPNLRLLSQFGRVNYDYANKYMLSATVRRDGADRFGPENRWGVFPGFSVGWRVNEEPFFNVDFISSLKLRASYGALGNFGSIPQYLYQSSYRPQDISALPDGTRIQVYGRNLSLPNEGIKWEEVKTTDIGFDASFLDGDLMTTVDWYVRNTQDMIYAVPVPLSAGFNGNPVFTNVGELRNTGVELMVNYRKDYGDFAMDLSLNGAYNKNEVISLDGTGTQAINSGQGGQYLSNQIARTTAGQPISQFFGYVVEGIFATDAEASNRGVVQPGAGAGDLIYKDVNGDGVITSADRDVIGDPWPKFNYGLNAQFNYKDFDLSLQLQGVYDVDVYNASKHYTQFLAGDYNSSPDVFGASFFNGNGLTDQPRLGYVDENGNYIRDPNANYTKISSYFVEDASYLKLRNIQLGYNLPANIVSALGIRSARVYLQGQNLLTITGYSGVDPEVLGEGITARGIDRNDSYPQKRIISLGLNLDF